MANTHTERIKPAKVAPAYLHANSTSHTTPFSAIAEIIDNAYDPEVNAKQISIEHRVIDGEDTMCFVDDGTGMTPDVLYRMLCFGYRDKIPEQVGNIKRIGYYGNGFKSGSMKLGKDALVITRCTTSTSVGLLSQTYMEAINADSVLVPIVTWSPNSYIKDNTAETTANLEAILAHSLFKTEDDMLKIMRTLEKTRRRTGTIIILYNLAKDINGTYELDFKSDPNDILNPETSEFDEAHNRHVVIDREEHVYSLREYCSILYLKPRMRIIIQGEKVKSKLISKSLSQTERDKYKPLWLSYAVQLTFGFTSNNDTDNYGLMMYHNNRLIRAYQKIGCQKKANGDGVGVVGVVEVDFLQPTHNKQDFNKTEKYTAFMQNAAIKLKEYYYAKTNSQNPDERDITSPDWTWAQCDNCLKWRRLPTGYNQSLPDKWYCRFNPDAAFNRCERPEEPEDETEAQESYKKSYKEAKKRELKEKKQKKTRAFKVSKSKAIEGTGTSSSEDDDGPGTSSSIASTSVAVVVNSRASKRKRKIDAKKREREIKKEKLDSMELIDMTEEEEENNDISQIDDTGPAYTETTQDQITSHQAMVMYTDDDSESDTVAESNEYMDAMKTKSKSNPDETNDPSKDITEQDTIRVNKSCQTVPTSVKLVSPEEYDLLTLSGVEAKNMLLEKTEELQDVKDKLGSLQQNIYELLKIIVPDHDYGETENIENFIVDLLRENREVAGPVKET